MTPRLRNLDRSRIRRYPQNHQIRRRNMTVCVAAIAEGGAALILASDRTLSGVAKWQSPDSKVYGLSSSIVAMWATEDTGFQGVVHERLRAEVNAAIKSEPETWLEVGKTAFRYQFHYNELRRHAAAQDILEPLGCQDLAEFIAAKRKYPARVVRRAFADLRVHTVAHMPALIVGMDNCGPNADSKSVAHIYLFDNFGGQGSTVACLDSSGFAAIGSGSPQATAQFEQSGYGKSAPLHEAVFLTYLAKKRGESAPGVEVGQGTDFHYFHSRPPKPGFIARVGDDFVEALERECGILVETEKAAFKKGEQVIDAMLKQRGAPQPPTGQAASNVPVPGVSGTGAVNPPTPLTEDGTSS